MLDSWVPDHQTCKDSWFSPFCKQNSRNHREVKRSLQWGKHLTSTFYQTSEHSIQVPVHSLDKQNTYSFIFSRLHVFLRNRFQSNLSCRLNRFAEFPTPQSPWLKSVLNYQSQRSAFHPRALYKLRKIHPSSIAVSEMEIDSCLVQWAFQQAEFNARWNLPKAVGTWQSGKKLS